MKSSVGFDNILPFVGVVEDREEGGAGQGRVRVRAFGVHPPYYIDGDNPNRVETEELPWAIVLQGGYGKMWSFPDIAEWVFGFFLDGRDAQHPVIIGTIPGNNLQLPGGPHAYAEVGRDGTNPYVKDSTLAYEKFGQPPVPPQISGEDMEETPLYVQMFTQKVGSLGGKVRRFLAGQKPSAKTDINYDEPAQQSGGTMDSSVWQTRFGGSYIEMNGSRGHESVTISQDTGSTVQLDSNGNVKIKAFGTLYQIAEDGEMYLHSDSAMNIVSKGDLNINSESGTTNMVMGGDVNHVVTGDYNLMVGGRFAVSAGSGFEAQAARISLMANAEHISLYSDYDVKIESGRELSMHSRESMWLTNLSGTMHMRNVGADVRITGATDVDMKSLGGQVKIEAAGGALSLQSSAAATWIDGSPDVRINQGGSVSAVDAEMRAIFPFKPQVEEAPEMGVAITDLQNGYASVGAIGAGDIDDSEGGGGGGSGSGTGQSGGGGSTGTTPGSYDPNPNAGLGATDRAKQAYDFFISRGYTPAQAAGLVGNLQEESYANLQIDAVGDGGKAYGIAQWHPDRQADFAKFAGKPIDQSTFEEQLEFVDWELNNTNVSAGNKLRKTNTPEGAAFVVDKYYERSRDGADSTQSNPRPGTVRRMNNATRLAQELGE